MTKPLKIGSPLPSARSIRPVAWSSDSDRVAYLSHDKATGPQSGRALVGELLILAIVQAGSERSGLFYASIPDSTPELVQPARDALAALKVDG